MSLKNLLLTNIKQDFNVKKENLLKYGEVRTDFKLIEIMFSLVPKELFKIQILNGVILVVEMDIFQCIFIFNY